MKKLHLISVIFVFLMFINNIYGGSSKCKNHHLTKGGGKTLQYSGSLKEIENMKREINRSVKDDECQHKKLCVHRCYYMVNAKTGVTATTGRDDEFSQVTKAVSDTIERAKIARSKSKKKQKRGKRNRYSGGSKEKKEEKIKPHSFQTSKWFVNENSSNSKSKSKSKEEEEEHDVSTLMHQNKIPTAQGHFDMTIDIGNSYQDVSAYQYSCVNKAYLRYSSNTIGKIERDYYWGLSHRVYQHKIDRKIAVDIFTKFKTEMTWLTHFNSFCENHQSLASNTTLQQKIFKFAKSNDLYLKFTTEKQEWMKKLSTEDRSTYQTAVGMAYSLYEKQDQCKCYTLSYYRKNKFYKQNEDDEDILDDEDDEDDEDGSGYTMNEVITKMNKLDELCKVEIEKRYGTKFRLDSETTKKQQQQLTNQSSRRSRRSRRSSSSRRSRNSRRSRRRNH